MNRPEPDEVGRLRVPPHSIEAEQSVLGALLIDNSAFEGAAPLLQARDFYRHEHRLIWSAVRALCAAGKPADVITVHEALAGDAQAVGGLDYLNALAMSVGGVRHVPAYARIVRQRSRERALITLCDHMASAAFNTGGADAIDGLIDAAITQLMALQSGALERAPAVLAELLPAFLDGLTDRYEGRNGDALATGLVDLDHLTSGGMRPGELWVIGARPSMGKTALTLTVSRNVADDAAALMLTQEDSAQSMVMRQVAARGRVNLSNLRAPQHAPNDMWGKVTDAVEALKGLRLYIDDQPSLTLADVRRKAQQVRRRDTGLRVVIVDYLQLMQGEGDNRNLELGRIANGLKGLAKEMGLTVVLCSQLNREADKLNGPPQLHHLRDSGDIEGAADVIGLLYRRFRVKPEPSLKHWAQLHVAKHKNGPTDTINLWFDGETQRFGDWEGPSPDSPRYRQQDESDGTHT